MQNLSSQLSAVSLACLAAASVNNFANANTLHDALAQGKASADFNLRYENVSQDNVLQDADALTLRTRIAYTSGAYEGWSFKVEMEDSRIVLGQGDYSVPPAGYNSGIYSVIADPEVTELDQGYIQYKKDGFTFKGGRQVIALDDHRFVGHVGWRQDRQTFDALAFAYDVNDKLSTKYYYVTQRNRIFGEQADLDSKDHLLNISYQTDIGKIVAYAYLLEVDNTINNSLNTYGAHIKGKQELSDIMFNYHVEVATQTAESGTNDFDATYYNVNVGADLGKITLGLGYEVLGSDDGNYGFSTPLATLHKFNGWADLFLATPAQGLADMKVSAKGKFLGGNVIVAYHNYEADKASSTVDDLGSEINAQYTTQVMGKYILGLKYAAYSGDGGRPDTDKAWIWIATKF